jgi:hypothetical protein
MANPVLRLVLPMLAAACVLFGVAILGRWAREGMRDDYQLPFTSIHCVPGPGLEQKDLLAEVQYLGGFPDQIRLLDDGLAERLRDAFDKHPWVLGVNDVKITSGRIEVRLWYRRAVLAVSFDGQMRAVDANGILLPATASTDGLPVYSGKAPPPAGPAGTRWGDKTVESSARAAALDRDRPEPY